MAEAAQQNLVLSRLSPPDLALMEKYMEHAHLPVRKVLERRDRRIHAVFFPESGYASVVADSDKRPIEVGLIGREGMTGLAVVLGADRSAHETFMQAAGHGRCIRAKHLRELLELSATLHRSMLRYAHAFLEQTTRTAVANGRNKLEERLARWILMAADRIDGAELPLTHEFLAMMLGVRRPGVTVAIQELEHAGAIQRRRGHIVIIDRATLERLSNGTYLPISFR
jgi:CRP-like cAMP-binding protein